MDCNTESWKKTWDSIPPEKQKEHLDELWAEQQKFDEMCNSNMEVPEFALKTVTMYCIRLEDSKGNCTYWGEDRYGNLCDISTSIGNPDLVLGSECIEYLKPDDFDEYILEKLEKYELGSKASLFEVCVSTDCRGVKFDYIYNIEDDGTRYCFGSYDKSNYDRFVVVLYDTKGNFLRKVRGCIDYYESCEFARIHREKQETSSNSYAILPAIGVFSDLV